MQCRIMEARSRGWQMMRIIGNIESKVLCQYFCF